MIRLNYLVAIPVVCILLEFVHLINLVVILVNQEQIWMLNLIFSGFNVSAVPPLDILLISTIVISLTVQLLFILWTSMEEIDECYTKGIGYLWIILAFLVLAGFFMFAVISGWYSQVLKGFPRIGGFFLNLSNITAQVIFFILTFSIGIFLIIDDDDRSSRAKKLIY